MDHYSPSLTSEQANFKEKSSPKPICFATPIPPCDLKVICIRWLNRFSFGKCLHNKQDYKFGTFRAKASCLLKIPLHFLVLSSKQTAKKSKPIFVCILLS